MLAVDSDEAASSFSVPKSEVRAAAALRKGKKDSYSVHTWRYKSGRLRKSFPSQTKSRRDSFVSNIRQRKADSLIVLPPIKGHDLDSVESNFLSHSLRHTRSVSWLKSKQASLGDSNRLRAEPSAFVHAYSSSRLPVPAIVKTKALSDGTSNNESTNVSDRLRATSQGAVDVFLFSVKFGFDKIVSFFSSVFSKSLKLFRLQTLQITS